ncbi:MAG: hypothetical protein AABY18_10120 [Candidatus Thermoplasmatota archaeon]
MDGVIVYPGGPLALAVDAFDTSGRHLVGTLTFNVLGPWRMRDVVEVPSGHREAFWVECDVSGDWSLRGPATG